MARQIDIGDRWALVTGGSSGIGLAIAKELAHNGLRLIIVGRNEQRLAQAEQVLRGEGAAEVITISADLATANGPCDLYNECHRRGLEVGLLVNNAGTFVYKDLVGLEAERVEQILALHVGATTTLCRLFVADMVAYGGGWVLNMSSLAEAMPLPGLGMYSATKAYVHNFSLALAAEVRERGVVVCSARPGGVATDLYGLPLRWQQRGVRWGVIMTPERVARRCIGALARGRRSVTPGVGNRIGLVVVRRLPRRVVDFLRGRTFGYQK